MNPIAARWTTFLFILSAAGSIGFATGYAAGFIMQWLSVFLGMSFGGLAAGLIVWARLGPPKQDAIEERHALASVSDERHGALREFERGETAVVRRATLLRLFFLACGTLGAALLFPIRSFGPSLSEIARTKWTPGARAVREDGTPVRVTDLAVGSMLTVFPEGFVGDGMSQTLLLRVRPDDLVTQKHPGWSPQGYIAYSKVCTHAGCPVGLFRAASLQLLCPCHQSVFDVAENARPVAGPAARPLPQLPLYVGADGFIRARSDYPEPVGPGYWQM